MFSRKSNIKDKAHHTGPVESGKVGRDCKCTSLPIPEGPIPFPLFIQLKAGPFRGRSRLRRHCSVSVARLLDRDVYEKCERDVEWCGKRLRLDFSIFKAKFPG